MDPSDHFEFSSNLIGCFIISEFLSQSSIDESDNSRTTMSNKNNQSVDRNVIKKQLLDMGFTSEQAVRALKRTKFVFDALPQ